MCAHLSWVFTTLRSRSSTVVSNHCFYDPKRSPSICQVLPDKNPVVFQAILQVNMSDTFISASTVTVFVLYYAFISESCNQVPADIDK